LTQKRALSSVQTLQMIHKRKPDISRAKELLGWEPKVPLHEGLPLMVTDFRKRIFGDQEESTEAAGGLS